MRIEQIRIFKFEELSEQAKERARDWWRSCEPWCWQREWWESAQAFSRIAPIDIYEADYVAGHVCVVWTDDSEIAELEGVRAWKWLQNNGWLHWAMKEKDGACSLTGYCGDSFFADPLAEYAANPLRVPDLKQVFYDCAQSWVYGARDDMEYSYSDESCDESMIINEYEFTEDGELYR